MSISNRIILGFAAGAALLVALGAYALVQVGAIRANIDQVVERDITALGRLDAAAESVGDLREARLTAIGRFLSGQDPRAALANWETRAATAANALNQLRTASTSYSEAALSTERAALWRQLASVARTAEQGFEAVRAEDMRQIAALRSGDRTTAIAGLAGSSAANERFDQSLATLRATLDETVRAGRVASGEIHDATRLSILVVLLLGLATAAIVALAILRSIRRPLDEFMGFVAEIGRGDLTGSAISTGRDELGQLGSTLNHMVSGLREIAAQNRQATENLNAAATEIRASTQEQAASVEEQLAAVQETAATVDEITHSGAQISRRAQEVIAAAQATVRTSDDGIAAVHGTARAMDAIGEQAEAVAGNIVALSEKTQAIGDIIATVNDVSERSHLLALNAAIEAAAAGENGRSFAIVAAEMKTLADQAKSATRNVRSLLGDIQRGITASVMLTEEAVKRAASGKEQTDTGQRAIEALADRIQESVQTFQQIVASTNQQQIGIEQVTIALQNIRQASQQTAASTRQLDQAAGDLTRLARTLIGLTERYRI